MEWCAERAVAGCQRPCSCESCCVGVLLGLRGCVTSFIGVVFMHVLQHSWPHVVNTNAYVDNKLAMRSTGQWVKSIACLLQCHELNFAAAAASAAALPHAVGATSCALIKSAFRSSALLARVKAKLGRTSTRNATPRNASHAHTQHTPAIVDQVAHTKSDGLARCRRRRSHHNGRE